MIKHESGLSRPETEIEKWIRNIGIRPPDTETTTDEKPIQIPGFTNPNDSRIPETYREMQRQRQARQRQALAQFTKREQRR